LAVLTYEAQYHCFPPAYIPDKDGKPMHSWRVLMLPYLQYKDRPGSIAGNSRAVGF
jgi:hypothetical protein